MLLRPVTAADKAAVLLAEAKSTPRLRYLPAVYELFLADAPLGEFMLVEEAGEVLGCAKYTLMPDRSAWLETLRVIPEAQGRGLGKSMYRRFFELACAQGMSTMRMYTGIGNQVSRGLAEHFGFRVEETFLGYSRSMEDCSVEDLQAPTAFQPVTDPQRAGELLLAAQAEWGDFVVMNRTFYRLSAPLAATLAQQGMVFQSSDRCSVVVLGARFSPEQALHVGLWSGDPHACLTFAERWAQQRGIPGLSCLFPEGRALTQQVLETQGYRADPSPYIVMRVDL